jgi:hypothetical protein
MFFAVGFGPQRHRQHLFAKMNSVDQDGYQIESIQFFLAQFCNCAALACTNSRLTLDFSMP